MIRRDVALMGTARPEPDAGHGRIDADDPPAGVCQRPAGAAGVEGRVGLDDVLDHAPAPSGPDRDRTAQPADHAGGDGAREPERIAHGDDQLADPEGFGVAEFRRRRRRGPAVDHGKIGERVGAHHVNGRAGAVGEDRVAGLGAAHHVGIRQQISVRGEQHGRTRTDPDPAVAPVAGHFERGDVLGDSLGHADDRCGIGIQRVLGHIGSGHPADGRGHGAPPAKRYSSKSTTAAPGVVLAGLRRQRNTPDEAAAVQQFSPARIRG